MTLALARSAAREIVRILAERGQTLAVAESLTGGLVADCLSDVPGASAVLRLGVVSYTDAAKNSVLGVDAATLERHSAVSSPVAAAMAEGVRELAGADYSVATTGYAGPGGGSESDPVGTFYVGLVWPDGRNVFRLHSDGERRTVKEAAAAAALTGLLRVVQGEA